MSRNNKLKIMISAPGLENMHEKFLLNSIKVKLITDKVNNLTELFKRIKNRK